MTIAIKDFMSAPVISCTIEANIGQVRDLMEMKGFSAVPVVQINDDTYTVKGIVTYRDIAGVYDDNVNVQQIMTQQLKVIPPDTNAQEAAGIMQQFGIHHLVAVEDDRIVGLVSSADFVKLVSSYQLC